MREQHNCLSSTRWFEPKDIHTGNIIGVEQFNLAICIWMCIYFHACICVCDTWYVFMYMHGVRFSDKRN